MHIACLVRHRFVTRVVAILVDATTQLKFELRELLKRVGNVLVYLWLCRQNAATLMPRFFSHWNTFVSFSIASAPDTGACPMLIFCSYRELSPRVESPELETDHSAPSAAKFRIAWFCTASSHCFHCM
jgi:hypothetical protein